MISIILVFVAGLITMFPLKKVAQGVYDQTGYNAVRGLPKFLTVLFGLADIFLAIVLSVTIEESYIEGTIGVIAIFVLFILLLMLVNKKAGLKNALLLAVLQNISGAIVVILLIAHRAVGGILSSNVLDILSINEN